MVVLIVIQKVLQLMTEVSASIPEIARMNQTLILRQIATKTQAFVASVMGVDPSTVNRMMSPENVEKSATFLAAAGLRLVPAESKQYDPDYIRSLQVLAARCIELERGHQ